ncbi:hypothetical protein GOBAR_AA04593 [Gossypium barbadense]|uniref:Uncharacterized protein n=1 Tax=Gossypium barbadense TaxID=3634 RepID=A0A2P5YK56_GOSBA|nr:hypothetical protein GOBAR_AA04593 [Gossypium barbadense]
MLTQVHLLDIVSLLQLSLASYPRSVLNSCHLLQVLLRLMKSGARHVNCSRQRLLLRCLAETRVTVCLTKIKKLCDLLAASSNHVSNDEQVGIVLAVLSINFEAVVTIASFVQELLKMDRLIYRRLGHLAQSCYYQLYQSFDGIPMNDHSRSPKDFSADESVADGETGFPSFCDSLANKVTYLPQPNVFGFGHSAVFGPSSQPIGHIVCARSCSFPFAGISHGTSPSCASVGPLSRFTLGNTGATPFSPRSMHFHTDSGSSHSYADGPSMFYSVGLNASGSGSCFGSPIVHSTRLVLPPTFFARPNVSLPQPSAEPFV